MKKKTWIIIGILALILIAASVVYLCVKLVIGATSADGQDEASVESARKLVTETYPTNFVIYGDKFDFDSRVSVTYIDSISEETLTIDSAKYKQLMIIVSDLDGNLSVTDEEWLLIKKYIEENDNYSFYYVGNDKFEKMQELGVIDISTWSSEYLSVGMIREKGQMIYPVATYNKQTQDLNLSELIIHDLAFALKLSAE